MLGAMGLMAAGGAMFALPAAAQKGAKPGARIFDVKEFGATGDGKTLDTVSINRAVDACNAAGGGVVYVPPGIYLSGTVILKSNVTLYLEAGATLLGSKNLDDYGAQAGPPAKGDMNQKHLVFARDAENVGLTGLGKIDGQGSAFWVPSGRVQPPPEDGWKDVIAYDWKPLPRPSPMLEFYNCKNLHIEDVRIENSPGWTLRPIHCDNVFISGISIKSSIYGSNTDGIDPTCCHNVFISDCVIDSGDDAICLKSENPYGEDLRVSKNITITNCVLSGCCNGLKFGTATHGGYENIVFTNSVIFNEDVPLGSRVISGIALEIVDGGYIDGVVISNIQMQRVRTPIFIRRGNRKPRPDGSPGTLRGVMIENVHATGSILTSSITGLPGFNVEDVTLSNIRIDSEEGGKAEWTGLKIPEVPKTYPEARMFGRLPAYGFYCRHVTGLRMRNLEFKAAATEARPVIFCDDVNDLDISGLRSAPIVGTQPAVKLVQTRKALLQNCLAPAATKTFLEVQGDKTEDVVLMDSHLGAAENATQAGPAVPKDSVVISGNVGKT
jgi:polygalacturonase